MALVSGQLTTVGSNAVLMAQLPGRTAGMEVPDFDYGVGIYVPANGEWLDGVLQDELGNPITDENGDPILIDGFEFVPILAVRGGPTPGTPAGPPHTTGTLVSTDIADRSDLNTGQDWFEKIHIFPGSSVQNPSRLENYQIDFGNILATTDVQYEVYNAFRRTDVVLLTVQNNVQPGVETPDVTPPVTVYAQCSILDPTSTKNTDGTTGLGTKVRTVVRALRDGLPRFDDTIDFLFDTGGPVSLLLKGQRIALITAKYGMPLAEGLTFLTSIFAGNNGKEQRTSTRKQPREWWRLPFDLEDDERPRMKVMLLDWTDKAFGLPLWHEQVQLTAAASAGSTSFSVRGASHVDFRVGGLVCFFTSYAVFDVLQIATVSDTTITTSTVSLNSYPADTLVLPVRVCRLRRAPGSIHHKVALEQFTLELECTDNDTGAPAGSVAWNGSTYNGRILMDDANIVQNGSMSVTFDRRIYVVDNQTGVVEQGSPWAHSQRVSQKGFWARTRQKVLDLKAFLRQIRGKQKSFYLPTFAKDLSVVATLSIGTNTMDIENVDYDRFARSRMPMKIVRVTFTDGTYLERSISSSTVVSATVERLTLNTTWPSTKTASQVSSVQFYELVRFDTDEFVLEMPRIGLAYLTAPVRVVNDDDV